MGAHRGPRAADVALAVLLTLGALAAANALARVLRDRVALFAVQGSFVRLELGLLALATLAAALALLATLDDLRRGRATPRGAAFGALLVALVLGQVGFLAFAQPYQRVWLELCAGGVAGAWAASVLGLRRPEPPPRALRLAGRALVALCAAALLLELGLRAAAELSPSPLFARVGDAPRELLARFRCAPGEPRFGAPCDARGYYDAPLPPRVDGTPRIAAIGDSMHLGAVPYELHFTSVLERELGLPVANFGVAGVGPPEYLAMLVEDALPLEPELVLVGLFVGNDLASAPSAARDAWLRSFLERERVLLWVLPRRLSRLAEERARRGDAPARVQGEGAATQARDEAALAAQLPWTVDPTLEEPSLSEEAFLRLELERALDVCAGVPRGFEAATRALLEMRAACGERPFAVLLLPDEFQVEDALWSAVEARAPIPLERDLPQRLLVEWLDARAIPHLDLLPILRAVPPLEDGRRHLYHLRDTHLNARGNRVVGEALSAWLPRLLR